MVIYIRAINHLSSENGRQQYSATHCLKHNSPQLSSTATHTKRSKHNHRGGAHEVHIVIVRNCAPRAIPWLVRAINVAVMCCCARSIRRARTPEWRCLTPRDLCVWWRRNRSNRAVQTVSIWLCCVMFVYGCQSAYISYGWGSPSLSDA